MADSNNSNVRWRYFREMWSGLGLFLVIVLIIIVAFLNGGREHNTQIEKIKACEHASDVAACIKQVVP